MSALTGDTEVFSSSAKTGRCVVMFLARRQPRWRHICSGQDADLLLAELSVLAREGWLLSIRAMFDPAVAGQAVALDVGFAHDVDMAGVFEAPGVTEALAGTVRLERCGWARFFSTEWLLGPREFASVRGDEAAGERPWGFLALWEWNDSWAEASPPLRADYDAECDIAFKGDLAVGMNIAGRHRLDWAHHWHHLGAWEAPSVEAVDRAIAGHERIADFKFTTSRHFIGRVRPFGEFIGIA